MSNPPTASTTTATATATKTPVDTSKSSSLASQVTKSPRIIIQFCTKCKWTNRAIWYAQELFQTFGDSQLIGDISLQPIVEIPGTFQILVQIGDDVDLIYRRRFKKDGNDLDPQLASVSYAGFPDAKFLKNLVRAKIHEIESREKNSGDVSSAQVGDHLVGEGSLLNEGPGGGEETEEDDETEDEEEGTGDCVACKREE
ncbi:hypothetical protein I9W82_001958 [Candida metapsilosis]|uniref:Uncharacterized protein n=1 Tax=Candida metapsilosis TaxID=273372 RepID=A0A8H7ZIY7_9ASCO|nr:hypothetical protein I9W82_001958 [Candida metapsilosis]